MTEEGLKCEFTVVPSADVEVYIRLMGDDESATIHTLTAYRVLMYS